MVYIASHILINFAVESVKMMQPEMNVKSDFETKEPVSKVDIVKEVASALEDEDFLKDEPNSVKLSPSTTSRQKHPVKAIHASRYPSTPAQSLSGSSPVVLTSPGQQRIRSELVPLETPPASSTTSTSSSTSTTTWQNNAPSQPEVAGGGVWGWMSSAVSVGLQTTQNIGRNIVEKTKSSVDTVITTLDPAMEDYLYGREQTVNFVLTTEDHDTIDAIRDGFRQIFELAFIEGCSSISSIAPLPMGCSAGLKGAQHRVSNLRRTKKVKEEEVVLGIEELVAELIPGKWFSMICLFLSDPNMKFELQTFSQANEVPKHYISKAEQSTPSNYNLRWSGLSYTLGEVILGVGKSQGDWQSMLGGCSRRQILTMAARTLAGQYRNKLNEAAESVMDKAVVM